MDYARGRGLVGAKAAPRWRGLGRREPQDRRDLGVQCRGLERAADHGHSVRTQWPVIPAVPCPSRYGTDRGHSVRTQWPVIPAVPCPGRYGADATSGRVGHSMALSRRPAEIAGVVEALMRHDALSGGSAEAGGDGPWTSRPRATRRMRPRARRRSGSLPRPRARGLARYGERASCRGLPWRASGEAETAFPAEAFPGEPRAKRGWRQDAETSSSRLEARRGRTQWARLLWVRGPQLTF